MLVLDDFDENKMYHLNFIKAQNKLFFLYI